MKGSNIDILYEDNHLLIINKAAGELVQGDKTGDMPISERIKAFIKKRDQKPGNVFLGISHRLDRPVTGVIVFAKTSKALSRLNRMFQQGKIKKTYWAITETAPPKQNDRITHYLKRNEQQNKSYAHQTAVPGSKEAILEYEHLAKSEHYHLLSIRLLTGRHHQIRSQLSAIGCCIKGDLKYGARRSNPDKSISLHARTLHFEHPVKLTEVIATAGVPKDNLWYYFEEKIK